MPTQFGWGEYLGGFRFNSSLTTSGRISIVARDTIWVHFNIAGYGGSDIASLRFNGDTGNNYQTRFLTVAIASVTFTNVNTLSTGFLRLAGLAGTMRRAGSVQIMNISNVNKVCKIETWDDNVTGVGTETVAEVCGGGFWANTSAQITDIEMTTAGGATLPAGSGFAVFGLNLG